MATEPDGSQPSEQTRVERVIEAIVTPVQEPRQRLAGLLALAAFCAAFAPLPFGPVAAAVLVLAGYELGTRKR